MRRLLTILCASLLAGCQSVPMPPMETVTQVDMNRFMGDWYVIAHIPTFPERNAYNAIESYRLNPDGTVATTFTFREGGFDGEPRRMQPTGFVTDRSGNAIWGMQFIWPFKADYRIVYLRPDYGVTVIARQRRDYVWIMARSPYMAESDYGQLVERIAAWGYDVKKLRRVPQRQGERP
ncbi:MAG: lipocalin family protein [Parasulfuritortus sp.]|jgi:apolipoprotein D and lipocalin family protein|nr:lipocalin family protein [Parasulfuritortus sp.]